MAPQMLQYPPGTLLDATGNPFQIQAPMSLYGPPQPAPPGAYVDGYGAHTIIVEPGGGRIELTKSDRHERTENYADIYSSQPAVGAVVNKLVRQAVTIPLKVYQHAKGNRMVSLPPDANGGSPRLRPAKPQEVIDPDNSLWRLLNYPAPCYGPVQFLEWVVLPLYVNGNSLIAKFRGNGENEAPTELIPLDWRFVQAWARLGQPVTVWGSLQTGRLKWITPGETIHTAWASVSGSNGAWLGTSPLAHLKSTIKVDEAAQRWSGSYFENAARPGGMLVLPPDVNVRQAPEITSRIEHQVQEFYGGVDRAFRTMVLGGGAKWQQTGNNPGEAQLVTTREWDLAEVAFGYGLTRQDFLGPTSAESESRIVSTVTAPTLKMVADRINAQLVRPEPEWDGSRLFVHFEIDDVLYGDPLVRSDKMVSEVLAGIRSIDEARMMLGLEPRGGGADELLQVTQVAAGIKDEKSVATAAREIDRV